MRNSTARTSWMKTLGKSRYAAQFAAEARLAAAISCHGGTRQLPSCQLRRALRAFGSASTPRACEHVTGDIAATSISQNHIRVVSRRGTGSRAGFVPMRSSANEGTGRSHGRADEAGRLTCALSSSASSVLLVGRTLTTLRMRDCAQ
jgi:hypothetical protein